MLATTDQRDGDAQIAVPAPGGPLRSREVRHYRVRVRDVSGWSGWSDGLRIEAGLLEPGAWSARAITIPDDPGSRGQSPSPVLRREFDVPAPIASARLHVTALGVHQRLPERSPGLGRPAGTGLDVLSATASWRTPTT